MLPTAETLWLAGGTRGGMRGAAARACRRGPRGGSTTGHLLPSQSTGGASGVRASHPPLHTPLPLLVWYKSGQPHAVLPSRPCAFFEKSGGDGVKSNLLLSCSENECRLPSAEPAAEGEAASAKARITLRGSVKKKGAQMGKESGQGGLKGPFRQPEMRPAPLPSLLAPAFHGSRLPRGSGSPEPGGALKPWKLRGLVGEKAS